MEFFGIGSAYGFAKFAQLNVKWKKREGDISKQRLDTETPQIRQMREEAARVRKSNMISSLDAKLKGGGELTSDELEYLKENSPALYKEAVDIIRERQAYKKELENCKTKEDVERLNANKINGALSVARAIGSNANIPKLKRQQIMDRILKIVMGIQAEHVKFVKSPRYAELPKEQELIDEKKNKKKAAAAENETAEAPKQPELSFEETVEELKRLIDSMAEGENEGAAEATEQTAEANGSAGTNSKKGAEKSGEAAPRSRSAAKKIVNTNASSDAPKPVPTAQSHAPTVHKAFATTPVTKIYTAVGSVKTPSAPPSSTKVSVKA